MTKEDPLADEPFSYREIKGGRVQITCSGRIVKILTGNDAARFVSRIASADAKGVQLLMAKVTGQFKFGNERVAKQRGKRR